MAQPAYEPLLTDAEDHAVGRTADQAAAEADAKQAESAMLSVEDAIHRTDRARKAVEQARRDPSLALALREATQQLEAVRKQLFIASHFGGDQHRLL